MSSTATSKHILLVDDNETFIKALKGALEKAGYQVTTAANGKIASELFLLDDYDAVVSDINMPEMNGIQLLHNIKNQKSTPVILTTGFAEMKETKEAHEMGAFGFLAKPFKKEELLTLLSQCFHTDEPAATEAPKENLDHEFNKITLDEFISGSKIRYSIFVRVNETSYIKIAHEGEDLTPERVASYKAKDINFLYLRKEDFRKYIDFNTSLAPLVRATDKLTKEKKLTFVRHTNEILTQQLFCSEINDESFENASLAVENTTAILADQDNIFAILESLKASKDALYTHSVAVSLYSVMIAKEAGYKAAPTLFMYAMGGLLHDIGLKELSPELSEKPRDKMSHDEIEKFEGHPSRGLDILCRLSTIPDNVIQMVYQHHETCTGTGYPKGLSRKQIHPMAKVVALADILSIFLLGFQGSERLSVKEALTRIIVHYWDRLDSDLIIALVKNFKVDLAAEIAKKSQKKLKNLR